MARSTERGGPHWQDDPARGTVADPRPWAGPLVLARAAGAVGVDAAVDAALVAPEAR